jgi:hypothetical protein
MKDVVLPPDPQGKAYALLFGVEKYMEAGLDDVRYAERDATAIRDALLAIGYEPENVELILSNKATKTNIEYEVRQLAKSSKKADKVFFFFAGHGYTLGGQNFLLAHDTRRDEIENTSVSLNYVFTLFDESECRQVMFFLDCCHSGMRLVDGARGVLEAMSTDQLEAHFAKAEFRIVFSACDKDERSWPSIQFQHGYWTYHLLKALRGEESDILDADGRLRSSELQDYLAVAVPRDLALQSNQKRQQNPKMYGDVTGTFVVANLSQVLATIEAERKAQASGLKHSTLRASQEGRIRDLDGFNKAKGHTAPKYQSSSSRSWVGRLAEGDLKTELDGFFETIRKSRAYKSKDLKYDSPEGGSGGIRTPDFEFSITYSQSEDDPSEFEVVRELTRLNDPALLDQVWFNEMFRNVFDEAYFELDGHVDVPKLIERVEEIEAFDVDYDGGRTHCTITMEGFEGEITITADSLTYTLRDAPTPKDIALQLQEAHVLLLGTPEMQKALPL